MIFKKHIYAIFCRIFNRKYLYIYRKCVKFDSGIRIRRIDFNPHDKALYYKMTKRQFHVFISEGLINKLNRQREER